MQGERQAEAHGVLGHAAAGTAAGMVGLALVGVIEAAAVLIQAGSLADLGAVPFALVAYGLCGALAGLGLGLVGGVLRVRFTAPVAFYFALVFVAGAGVIGRFRVVRDLFDERLPSGILPLVVQGAVAAGLVLAGIGLYRIARQRQARPRLARPLGAVLGLALAAGVAAVAAALPRLVPEPAPVPRSPGVAGRPPVILIMVDTLRADHLSCYGYERIRTPHVDRLAADGVRFARAYAQASWTRPSVATILTSLHPSSHGAVHKSDLLGDRVITIAEVLQGHGYRTIGFANNANVTAAFNFQQGFDTYHYLAPDFFFYASESAAQLTVYNQLRVVRERFLSRRKHVEHYYQPAEVVTRRALEAIDREGPGPFFLFLHYMDPHDPYFAHPFDGEGVARVATPNPAAERAAALVALYDGEVAYLDAELGTLFDGLRARGLYDAAMIVLTADHGEEFHEHGGWWHGQTLYDEQIHVPLIIKRAGARSAGRVATGLATSLDIAPTVLAAVGAAQPEEMQGRTLDLDAPDAGSPAAVFAEEDFEGNVLQAVRTVRWKLITANPDNPRRLPANQLFEVATDAGEHADLFGQQRDVEMTLAIEMDRLGARARAHAGAVEQRAVDSATQDRLRALGYVN
jgi:arylsulfatase A-like enzyme